MKDSMLKLIELIVRGWGYFMEYIKYICIIILLSMGWLRGIFDIWIILSCMCWCFDCLFLGSSGCGLCYGGFVGLGLSFSGCFIEVGDVIGLVVYFSCSY